MPHARHALFVLTGMFCASVSHATPPPAAAIAWERCPVEYERAAPGLGKRIECAVTMVPNDWREVGGERVVPVGLVRIRAGNAGLRQGALFVNFGGPALAPGMGLMNMGTQWQAALASDPVEGDLRRLMQQFDMVTVVPRGLDDVTALACPVLDSAAVAGYLVGERNDANWHGLVKAAHDHADACSTMPGATLVNSEQHVRDMEHVRALLGEPRLNFYGASYGGWVGALYGTLFPAHVGRMVLDSSVDASGSMERFQLLRPQWRERDLTRFATLPMAKTPGFWGVGGDSHAIRTRLQAMPTLLRAHWGGDVVNPEDVLAALQVADLYQAEPAATRTRSVLLQRMADHHFHDRIDQTVRKRAGRLLDAIPVDARGAFRSDRYGWPAATLATYCNDGRWKATPKGIRAALGERSMFSTFDDGDGHLMALICARWTRGDAAVPSTTVLASVPPFLMIHGDLDRITPLSGARYMADALPNARLVVVTDLLGHGVMSGPGNCAVQAAGRYLLTGELPSAPRSTCVRGALVADTPGTVRDEL